MQCTQLPSGQGPAPGPAFPPSKSLFIYPKKVKDDSKLYLGQPLLNFVETLTIESAFKYDDRGNSTLTTVTSQGIAGGGLFKKTVQSAYGGGGSREQQFGKMTSTIVTTERLDQANSSIVHTTTFDYEDVSRFNTPDGLQDSLALVRKKLEPGAGAPIEQRTAYAYDEFGNLTTTTVCASNFDSCQPGADGPPELPFRTTRVSDHPVHFSVPGGPGIVTKQLLSYRRGQFPVRTTNAAGHAEYSVYNPVSGLLIPAHRPERCSLLSRVRRFRPEDVRDRSLRLE